MHKTNFGDEKYVQHKHKSHFVFVLHKHKFNFGIAPILWYTKTNLRRRHRHHLRRHNICRSTPLRELSRGPPRPRRIQPAAAAAPAPARARASAFLVGDSASRPPRPRRYDEYSFAASGMVGGRCPSR